MKNTLSMRNCFFNLTSRVIILLHVRSSTVSSNSAHTLLFYHTFEAEPFLLYGSVYHETSVCSLIHSLTHWTIRKNFHSCWWRGRSVFYSLSSSVFASSSLWSTWTNPKCLSLAKNIVTNWINCRCSWSTCCQVSYPEILYISKGKAIPLQAWTGPEVSGKLRLPDFKTISTWRW